MYSVHAVLFVCTVGTYGARSEIKVRSVVCTLTTYNTTLMQLTLVLL